MAHGHWGGEISYYYTDLLGPKILAVPPLIQGGYVAMGYASFTAARVILRLTVLANSLALVATFVMGTPVVAEFSRLLGTRTSSVSPPRVNDCRVQWRASVLHSIRMTT